MTYTASPQRASRAFLGMSHSPLLGLNPIDDEDQMAIDVAVSATRTFVHEFAPELIVLIGPDHYNGFFNELMPTFCIGTEATAVGDYLSPAGPLAPHTASATVSTHGALRKEELLSVLPDATAVEVLPALLRTGFLAQREGWLSVQPAAYPAVRRALLADGFPMGEI